MNTYLLSLLLGIIEGLTEFLPISSTAHLRLAQDYLGINMKAGYWKDYSVAIQLGAILSVPALFWPRIKTLLKNFPRGADGDKTFFTHPLSLVFIAFVTTAVPAFLLEKKIDDALEKTWIIGVALILGGIVMWVVDAFFTRPFIMRMEQMKPLHAVWIGVVQILAAVFPGTSRSMATIAAGQVAGLSRPAALEFSFFVSIPIMLAACGYKLYKAAKALTAMSSVEEIAYGAPQNAWLVLAIGFVVSFVVALIVNRWFINWVQKRGFAPFAIYRIVLGLIVLGIAWRGVA